MKVVRAKPKQEQFMEPWARCCPQGIHNRLHRKKEVFEFDLATVREIPQGIRCAICDTPVPEGVKVHEVKSLCGSWFVLEDFDLEEA